MTATHACIRTTRYEQIKKTCLEFREKLSLHCNLISGQNDTSDLLANPIRSCFLRLHASNITIWSVPASGWYVKDKRRSPSEFPYKTRCLLVLKYGLIIEPILNHARVGVGL